MTYIRHESLFSLQELYELEQKLRFEAIFSSVDITPILRLVSKKSRFGAPTQVNHRAMVYALIARIVERIPMVRYLIKRLKTDMLFRLDCGFSLAERIPSEASFSRLVTKISESSVLQDINNSSLKQLWLRALSRMIPSPSMRLTSKQEIRHRQRMTNLSLNLKSEDASPKLSMKLG